MSFKFKNETVNKYRELADKIKENLVVENNEIHEEKPHEAYYSALPEGITKKQVEELSKYNAKFVTAAHVAAGELAANIFKTDSQVDTVNASIGFFGSKDKIDMTINRSATHKNPFAKDGQPTEITKHLVTKATVTMQSGKGVGVKAVKDAMSAECADLFKS